MTEQDKALLSCPFCGSEVETFDIGYTPYGAAIQPKPAGTYIRKSDYDQLTARNAELENENRVIDQNLADTMTQIAASDTRIAELEAQVERVRALVEMLLKRPRRVWRFPTKEGEEIAHGIVVDPLELTAIIQSKEIKNEQS